MPIKDPREGQRKLFEVIKQPEKFLFGLSQVARNVGMALATPMVKDGSRGKEYAQAHTMLEDVPGTGKTALFGYVASAIDAKLGRVDGRPDMMPSDLTGREEKDKFTGIRTLLKGPLFSHILFGDEFNRTPPKSQAPLLGGMEGSKVILNQTNEKEGRIEAVSFPLYPVPDDLEGRLFFIVFATMNPLDFEGTYPLSEAQMERFTYKFSMGAPSWEEEKMIRANNVMGKKVDVVMSVSDILDVQKMVAKIELSERAIELRQRYLANSRPTSQDIREFGRRQDKPLSRKLSGFINEYVTLGCSRRRNFHMEAAAKAHAFMRGEFKKASVDDVKAIAHVTMEHVIQLDPRSIGDNISAKDIVEMIINETPIP